MMFWQVSGKRWHWCRQIKQLRPVLLVLYLDYTRRHQGLSEGYHQRQSYWWSWLSEGCCRVLLVCRSICAQAALGGCSCEDWCLTAWSLRGDVEELCYSSEWGDSQHPGRGSWGKDILYSWTGAFVRVKESGEVTGLCDFLTATSHIPSSHSSGCGHFCVCWWWRFLYVKHWNTPSPFFLGYIVLVWQH